MKLSDCILQASVVRDGSFRKTMYPDTIEPDSICYAVHPRFLKTALSNPNISAIITDRGFADMVDEGRGLVVVDDPQLAYYHLHNQLVDSGLMVVHTEHFIHPTARIASSAIIGRHVVIGQEVVVKHGAIIGDYTVIGSGTYVGENAVTGVRGMQRLVVRGQSFPVRYAGGVRIGQNCQILAGAILERPYQAFYTEIGDNCEISVRVVVGHGSRIGANTMVAGNALLAGNVMLGHGVWVGPSAVVSDGLKVGDAARISIGSVVVTDVAPAQRVSGSFAVDHVKQMRFHGRLRDGQF